MRSLICPVTGYLLGLDLGATSAGPLPLGVHSVALTSNSICAVCSTGHAQLSYFRDISEPGSTGPRQADETLDAVQYENETAGHFTGITLPQSSSRQSLATAENPLRLAGRLTAILACHVYPQQEPALAEIMPTVSQLEAEG
jgi:hypothetical protein